MKDIAVGMAQSKTIWVNAIVAALGYIMANSDALQVALSQKTYGLTLMAVGALYTGLRMVTNDGLADKAKQ